MSTVEILKIAEEALNKLGLARWSGNVMGGYPGAQQAVPATQVHQQAVAPATQQVVGQSGNSAGSTEPPPKKQKINGRTPLPKSPRRRSSSHPETTSQRARGSMSTPSPTPLIPTAANNTDVEMPDAPVPSAPSASRLSSARFVPINSTETRRSRPTSANSNSTSNTDFDEDWFSTPIPDAPTIPVEAKLKTKQAYEKAIRIHGPGVKRHDSGHACLTCRGSKSKKNCVVNLNTAGGNICAPCAKKKEKCSYTLIADAKDIDEKGAQAPTACDGCQATFDRAQVEGDTEYEATHKCIVLVKERKDRKTKATTTTTSACSACMRQGKRESCSLNSHPKIKNGSPRDLGRGAKRKRSSESSSSDSSSNAPSSKSPSSDAPSADAAS